MHGHVSALADGVEHVTNFSRDDPLALQALEHVDELFPHLRSVGARTSSHFLQQGLSKLPTLDKGCIRILGEEPFR